MTPSGDAAAVALQLAEKLAENAPLALAAVKKIVRAADPAAVQGEEIKKLMQSADVREGMNAFAERRAPKWTGE